MTPHGEPSTSLSMSIVNIGISIQLSDADEDAPATMFALTAWLLPRVPCIGEQIVIDALRVKRRVESVWWNVEGRVVVNLEQVRLGPEELAALERDGWGVASMEDEPPSEWLAG
jgi:hypothetical protein